MPYVSHVTCGGFEVIYALRGVCDGRYFVIEDVFDFKVNVMREVMIDVVSDLIVMLH